MGYYIKRKQLEDEKELVRKKIIELDLEDDVAHVKMDIYKQWLESLERLSDINK